MATKTSGGAMARVGLDAKMLVALVLCLALSAGTYLLFTKPQRAEAVDMAAQAKAANLDLLANQQRVAELTGGKKDPAVDSDLATAHTLDVRLPTQMDKVSLVATIPNLAAQYQVTINQMDPAATPDPVGPGNLNSQSFTVSAVGTTDALMAWVAALQAYPSTITVSAVTVTVGDGNQASASFTLKAYSVPTPLLGAAG